MKKVLAIVLALAMILGSFSFVAAGSSTEYSDVAGTKYEGAVAVLGALDVVSGYPDGTYKPAKVVTRAEMCKLIITALGLDDYVAGSYAGYPDVAGSHWATSYIAYATSLGIINGYPDGTFKPENPVTYQEAAAMLVRALGYQDQYLIGSWPASHVNVAISEGILDGVKATAEGANRGDIALMVYNSLTCPMVQYNALGTIDRTVTSMLTRMGAHEVTNAIFDQDLAHDALKAFGLDMSAFVGAKVDYYWIDADKTDGNTYQPVKGDAPVVIAKEKSTFLTGEYKLNGADPDTFVVGDTTYKFKTGVTPNSATDDFYNGSNVDLGATGDVVDLSFSGNEVCTLAVKLNGIYIDEVYSAAVWTATNEMQWNEDYADTLAAKDKIDTEVFKMTKTDAIDYSWLTLVGVEDLAAIPNDAIVTVYADKDGTITKIGVATDVVTGKITKKAAGPSEDKHKYTIGENVYQLTKAYACDLLSDTLESDIKLGAEGTFYLNYEGRISAIKADDAVDNYAIVLLDAKQTDKYGAANAYEFYLLNKAGEKVVYTFAKDADGLAAISAYEPGDLITFKTNAEGKIVKTALVLEKAVLTANPLTDAAKAKLADSLTDKGIMDGKLIADGAVVFDVKAGEIKDWKMGDLANLATGDKFTANAGIAYNTNAKGKIDVIVIYSGTNTKSVSNLGIFTGWYTTYDEKGDEIYGGTMIQNGAVVDYVTDAKTIDADLGTDVADYDAIYKLTYKAGAVTDATAAGKAASAVPMKEAELKLASADYAYYNGGTSTLKALDGDLTNFYLVEKKADGTIDLGVSGTPNYVYIGDAANVYKVTMKADGTTYDKLALGSASDVKKGAYVMLLQLDKTSGAWDTIVYVTADDAAKITWQ